MNGKRGEIRQIRHIGFCRLGKNEIWYNNRQRRTGMPRLMEKKDWMQTVANVGSAENAWYENESADSGFPPLSFDQDGDL